MIHFNVFYYFFMSTIVVISLNVVTNANEGHNNDEWKRSIKEDSVIDQVPTPQQQDGFTHIPKLTPYEQYRDLFIISESNFSKSVLGKEDPWIIIFHEKGEIVTGWKTMAASLRGITWVGVVDKEESDLLSQLGIDAQTAPPAFVYPYGSKKFKKTHVSSVFTPLEAKNKVVQSIPDNFQTIKGDGIEGFLMDSFTAGTSKFPALLLNFDKIAPPVFKALARRFEKYFNFGIMANPSSSDMSALGLQNYYFDFPSFLIMVTTSPIEPKLNAVMYKTEEMGEMNYPNLMKFLFYVNSEYRYQLPGDNKSNEETEAKMLDVKAIEEERFDFVEKKNKRGRKVPNVKIEL